MTDSQFRSNVLTICGALGYLAFIAAGFLRITGYPVSWHFIGLLLLTSSVLMGVDFGQDVFAIQITTQNSDREEDK